MATSGVQPPLQNIDKYPTVSEAAAAARQVSGIDLECLLGRTPGAVDVSVTCIQQLLQYLHAPWTIPDSDPRDAVMRDCGTARASSTTL